MAPTLNAERKLSVHEQHELTLAMMSGRGNPEQGQEATSLPPQGVAGYPVAG